MMNNTSESKKRTKRAWFFDHSPAEVSYFMNDHAVCLNGRPLVFVAEISVSQFPNALLWCMMWRRPGIVQNNVNSAVAIDLLIDAAGMMPTAKSVGDLKKGRR